MSTLKSVEKRKLEQLFGMSSGYVLHFSDKTFSDFFVDFACIDIHTEKYQSDGTSKAKKLRQFWRLESDFLVGKVLLALIDEVETPTSISEDNALLEKCREIANRLLAGGPNLAVLKEIASEFGAKHLAEQISRIEQAVEGDPALAIGTAKELVETCCKTILRERGKPADKAIKLPHLTKTVFKELKLVPDGVSEAARGAGTIKVLLNNLATISQGLAEIRNLYGAGHGKDGSAKGLTPRHARLAVGAASTLTTFLFETHKESL